MSTSTHFKLLNAKDVRFIGAKNNADLKDEWEDNFGPIDWNPGAVLEIEEGQFVEETDDEYGGWIIDLSKLPKEATHIKIERF